MTSKTPDDASPNSFQMGSRRRRYLVDRRRQLSATLRVVGLVFVLLVLLNGTIAYQNHQETKIVIAENPEIGNPMRVADNRNLMIMISISLIILAMVTVRSIMITHRTSGAVHNITKRLESIASGDYNVTLRLREEDTIRSLEDPFNRMAKALRMRAEEDHRTLSKLATDMEEHGSPVDAEMVRRIAESKGRLLR